jgi:predicted nucleic acid-binding protein
VPAGPKRWPPGLPARIVLTARALGCTHVLSEDLSDGQDYGGVRVINPFR